MTRVLQAAGVWLAIMAIVWLATLWQWQTAGHQADDGEIVSRLFVLPLMLTAAAWLALWGVRRLREQAVAPAMPSVSAPGGAAPLGVDEGAPCDADARRLKAWILAEAVHLPAGDAAAGAWAALRSRASRPRLDAAFEDVDGMPVMAARALASSWDDAHALEGDGIDGDALAQAALPPDVRRCLALLASPLDQLLGALQDQMPFVTGPGLHETRAHATMDGLPADDGMDLASHLSGVAAPLPSAERRAREVRAPHLTVRVLWPAHWGAADREAALAWLRGRCETLLEWAAAAQAHGVSWQADAVAQPEHFWDELDQAIVRWSRQPRPELLLALAVDSLLTADLIQGMQSRGELFTATHQTGRMPGEGAAGLLIASMPWHGGAAAQAPVCLWRPSRTRRDKSADALGRVGITSLQATLAEAASLCGAEPGQLVAVADADHRASRAAELFESLQEAMPGIDPMLSVVRVGEACGELGMARALAPTALACAALREGEGGIAHALGVHLQSSHDRVVVALSPSADAVSSSAIPAAMAA